jgi:DNA-binding helix-hairpin-helix protein with protein kinase domain
MSANFKTPNTNLMNNQNSSSAPVTFDNIHQHIHNSNIFPSQGQGYQPQKYPSYAYAPKQTNTKYEVKPMNNTLPSNLIDSKGNPVVFGKKIGGGGEGNVYEVTPSSLDVLAKVYHKTPGIDRQEKLKVMANGCNNYLKEFAAWPMDTLHDKKTGEIYGFIMPKVTDCEPIHKLYNPSQRKLCFPNADWKFLVRIAKNLAAAFYIIHKCGYVIGDVNEGNILVTKRACVRLIDCDSFQVHGANKSYLCEVGVAQYTPPELQKAKDFKMVRTQNHDNFGLAILIFLLLFMGRHPYSGIYRGSEDMPIEKAISEYRFAYSKSAGLKSIAPPKNAVAFQIIPVEIANLFERAFTEVGSQPEGRPTANEWWAMLNALEKRLKKCSVEPMHSYYDTLASCPWCRLEQSSGIKQFLNSDVKKWYNKKGDTP